MIGSLTDNRREHQSLLAGFSLEPDALDKSFEERQSILNNYLPYLKDSSNSRTSPGYRFSLSRQLMKLPPWHRDTFCGNFANHRRQAVSRLRRSWRKMEKDGEASRKCYYQLLIDSHSYSENSEPQLMRLALELSANPDQTEGERCLN